MSLESNKTLGGIGAILIAIGSIVPIIGIIGIILVMIAIKGLAEHYGENDIFQNALYGIIFYIIAVIAAAVVLVGGFFGGMFVDPFTFVGSVIIAAIAMFIFYLLGAIFFKKSFNILSIKTGEKMFDTAGLLLLIGAILTIILIGAIIMLIAWILAAVAFFSIKTPPAQPPPAPPQAPPPPP